MAKCFFCKLEMSDEGSVSCLITENNFGKRDSSCFDINDRCHDCNIVNKEGNYHHEGCDMERCNKCGGQALSCDCVDKEIN